METFFAESLGINHHIFAYVILPLLIFLARIVDVSINTIRIIFVLNGQKYIATLLGFFESLIWLMAIGQIFQHLNNWASYIAYPAGFAMGILVGMLIEERLAMGKMVVRVISSENLDEFLNYLHNHNFRYTILSGKTSSNDENILFTVVPRNALPDLLNNAKEHLPQSFYTVESVKKAGESGLMAETAGRRGMGSWLSSVKRK